MRQGDGGCLGSRRIGHQLYMPLADLILVWLTGVRLDDGVVWDDRWVCTLGNIAGAMSVRGIQSDDQKMRP
jgi:hypothetical protein